MGEVLEMTELARLQHSIVGDGDGGQGLSVEQRKRLSIAVELVAAPAALFLEWVVFLFSGFCFLGLLLQLGMLYRLYDSLACSAAGIRLCHQALCLPNRKPIGPSSPPPHCSEPTSGLDARAAAIVMRTIQVRPRLDLA